MLVDVGRRREYVGLTQWFATLPRGELILNRFDPGANLSQHNHEHVQFGFSLVGEFDLLVGERMAQHTISNERAYTLGPNVLHGAVQRIYEPILSIDLKLLIPKRSMRFPEVSFHEPSVERFEWGKSLAYDHPWWRCRCMSLDPYRRIKIEAGDENQRVVVVERGQREFGRIYKAGSPTVLESDDEGLFVVCVGLRNGGAADGDQAIACPRSVRSSEGPGGRQIRYPSSDQQ